MKIPYGRQSIREDDILAVTEVLRSDWLTQGPKVKEFEEALCELTGAKHCVAVSNGTMALHLACLALDVGPGDTGLTTPISFMASANCIVYCGGDAAFADIDAETLCLSPERVEEHCRNHGTPRVVIPVDFAGVPADLPRFRDLSDQYGFKLIEDAAHSVGSTYRYEGVEYPCGSCAHTDLAIFSFHPVKTITTGEGGAVLTNDAPLAHRLRLLGNHGIEREPTRFVTPHSSPLTHDSSLVTRHYPYYHEMQTLGFNGRLTDIQCALGLSQLRRLGTFKARRQEIARAYNGAFQALEERDIVLLPPWPSHTDPCFHLYPIRLGPECPMGRDQLFMELRDRGIYCQVHYIPIYRQPFYQKRYGYDPVSFPEAERYFENCLSVPLFPDMEEDTVDYVLNSVLSLLQ